MVRDPGSGVRGPGSVVRDPGSVVRDPGSVVRDPGSVVRDPGSVVRDPRCEVPGARTLRRIAHPGPRSPTANSASVRCHRLLVLEEPLLAPAAAPVTAERAVGSNHAVA